MPKSMSDPAWRVIIHGGSANSYPDISRQNEIEDALKRIASHSAKSLEEGAYAKEVVVQAVSALEDCPLFNAGKGSALTKEGDHELEAGIVDGHSGHYGAVGCVRETKNPIRTASALSEQGPHCMIVGKAADDLTKSLGLKTVPNEYFLTEFRREFWKQKFRAHNDKIVDDLGTVGAIVLDRHGHLAAGGSTGGITGKMSGRIGDTAVLGAGLFANDRLAVMCSGAGDQILQHLVATKAANYYTSGFRLTSATQRALTDMSVSGESCAVAAISSDGAATINSTAKVFYTASMSAGGTLETDFYHANCPFMVDHLVYEDPRLCVGLSRFPTTKGQAIAILRQPSQVTDLFSLDSVSFSCIMQTISEVAAALCRSCKVQRCALVTEGSNSIAIIPLHGLSQEWQPITSGDPRVFYEEYPGYITSKDGPPMSESQLDEICLQIQKVSGIITPCNNTFYGEQSNSNLFAKIVRGELPQRRIWESDQHVAFLTPFANTPGFTVLVPRAHLPSDIFSLDKAAYAQLVEAAHTVAQVLKRAFGVEEIGMIFEGFEIDYAHVKLVPIRNPPRISGLPSTLIGEHQEEYHETYPGYVTSLQGPLDTDSVSLSNLAQSTRTLLQYEKIKAPKSWLSPTKHTLDVLREPWYTNLVAAQDSLFHESIIFFNKTVGYKFALVPATTDAISSPMGLGSDSLPVSISFLGKDTRLADSMQFALEYFLRVQDGVPGVYYINNSFRGEEEADSMHLNQFYHVECELLGDFDSGVTVAEEYIVNIVSTFLRDHARIVRTAAGTCTHLQSLLNLYYSNGRKFPRITQDEAFKLPMMDASTWRYIIPDDPQKGRAITRAGELKLIQQFGGAVWLTDMDHLSVPFYQAFTDSTCIKGRCADFLLGNGEVLGLGERHRSAVDVKTALEMHGTSTGPYQWYMDMRDVRPLLTTGWGMGIERFLAWVLGHDDIRDLAVMPRMRGMEFVP